MWVRRPGFLLLHVSVMWLFVLKALVGASVFVLKYDALYER